MPASLPESFSTIAAEALLSTLPAAEGEISSSSSISSSSTGEAFEEDIASSPGVVAIALVEDESSIDSSGSSNEYLQQR